MAHALAAIAAHSSALDAFMARLTYAGSITSDDPDFDAAEIRRDQARDAERKAWLALASASPRTPTELAAYALHLSRFVPLLDEETDKNAKTSQAFEALFSAALALAGQPS